MLAELVELAPGGVEEDRGDGYVEYAIYGAPGELPALPDLEAVAGDGLVEVTLGRDPRRLGRPLAGLPPAPPGRRAPLGAAVLGGAAGGARSTSWSTPARRSAPAPIPTTRMCLELLLELADAGQARGPLADWGTGSGVLAIAAAKLGFGPVVACDHEPAALEAAGDERRGQRRRARARAAATCGRRLPLRRRPRSPT